MASAPTAVMIEMTGASRYSAPIDVGGPERLLHGELDDFGQGLHQAERADAVGAVAPLEPAKQLALVDDQDRARSPKITAKIASDLMICTHQGSK